MLSECQTVWIMMRRRVTRRLIGIQAVCIWHYGRAMRSRVKTSLEKCLASGWLVGLSVCPSVAKIL